MMSSELLKVFASPERYVQGRNATDHLGAEMKKLDLMGPVVIVTSGTPKRLLEKRWTKSLQDHGYTFTILDFCGICTAAEVQRIADEAIRTGARALIAFGGGQVIDAARAAIDLVRGKKSHVCEFVSCPTVASTTDAPCSALCALYNENHTFDQHRFVKRHPTLVLVDTTAIAQSPRRMLVGGLGDVLATWFETRTVKEAGSKNFLGGMPTETSTALSKLCADIFLKDGPSAVEALEAKAVTPALERVIEANTLLSGLGFESGGLCVAHSVHNGLTTQPAQCIPYTHGGEKVAFGLMMLTQLILEGRPREEIDTILRFSTTVGLPVTLREVGVDKSNEEVAMKEISERAVEPTESSHNEPFEVTVNMMADAIRTADRAGAVFLKQKGIQALVEENHENPDMLMADAIRTADPRAGAVFLKQKGIQSLENHENQIDFGLLPVCLKTTRTRRAADTIRQMHLQPYY
jgi:glycerol dehydrogenase